MPNVKTAISVEEKIFDQMNTLAKHMKISRSRAFALAAEEFIERQKNIELLKALDEAYADQPEDSDSLINRMRSRHYDSVKGQW